MNKSEQVNDLFAALAKAQGEFKSIPMDKVNPHFKNKYASLTATQDATRAMLSKHGLGLIQSIDVDGENYYLETMLTHSSGQWISSRMKLLLDRQNMQGMGSATTYAKRYAWQAILGVVGDEDDDGEAAVAVSKPQPAAKATRPPNKAPGAATDDPVDYIPTFGKFKGKRLGEIDPAELVAYADYIEDTAAKENKPIQGSVADFLRNAHEIIALRRQSVNDFNFNQP